MRVTCVIAGYRAATNLYDICELYDQFLLLGPKVIQITSCKVFYVGLPSMFENYFSYISTIMYQQGN